MRTQIWKGIGSTLQVGDGEKTYIKHHGSRREGVERPLKTEYLLMVFFDLQSHKFINAYAAFLKRQGKLPIPGMSTN